MEKQPCPPELFSKVISTISDLTLGFDSRFSFPCCPGLTRPWAGGPAIFSWHGLQPCTLTQNVNFMEFYAILFFWAALGRSLAPLERSLALLARFGAVFDPSRAPKGGPRVPQERPRAAQERPKSAQGEDSQLKRLPRGPPGFKNNIK